jgi:hypothetical protein
MTPPANSTNAVRLYERMAEELTFNPRENLENI